MDEIRASGSLAAWSLGTFHTLAFLLALLIPLYAAGALGWLLDDLGTLPGFALFTVLWALSGWGSRRALQGAAAPASLPQALFTGRIPAGRTLLQAALWGALTGLLFTLAFTLGFALLVAPGIFLYLPFAVILALPVGAVTGLLLALLDLALLGLARAELSQKERRQAQEDTSTESADER
jgi:hypothetical protein